MTAAQPQPRTRLAAQDPTALIAWGEEFATGKSSTTRR
jgi:hypothetical protein